MALYSGQKIIILGKDGQLGWELQRSLAPLGQVTAFGRQQADLSDPQQAAGLVQNLQPQVIVNAAAYTAVDRAETDVAACMAINAHAPALIAQAAAACKAVFIHFSTDYVFDGRCGRPYTESDPANPLNLYGKSKLAGENAVLETGSAEVILRTSWVYSLRRPSFVSKIIEWARVKPSLRVVTDQTGSPTWSRALAETTALMLAGAGPAPFDWFKARRGIYHLAGDGSASRYDLARFILAHLPHPEQTACQELLPAATGDFPAPALRPAYSALNCERFKSVFNLALPAWDASLQMALEELA